MKSILNKIISVKQNLTNKSIIIENKIKNDLISIEEYNVLTNKINELKNKHFPDLVSLGILPKQISEFTNDDIGTIILIPYNDESGEILLNNGCIEFEIVGVNHHKDINDETKPTITLMTKNIIRTAEFDEKEPNNPNSARAKSGNNRWSVSNIRQWLNSEGIANEWFIPQHEYDEAGYNNNEDAYADDPGFLAGFSAEIKQYFATVRNKTILCNVDKSALSKDYEETEDKVFLPSSTELGCRDLDSNNPEGSHLDQKFIDDRSRVKNGSYGSYWLRTPNSDVAGSVCYIGYSSLYLIGTACAGEYGVAPLIVLC